MVKVGLVATPSEVPPSPFQEVISPAPYRERMTLEASRLGRLFRALFSRCRNLKAMPDLRAPLVCVGRSNQHLFNRTAHAQDGSYEPSRVGEGPTLVPGLER